MDIIINADDFGYSIDTNETIDSLLRAGKITSTTVMANGPASQDALNRIKDISSAGNNISYSFGVHLNLTEFRPLSSSQALFEAGLVNREGVFTKNIRKSYPTPVLLAAIEQEWGNQIESVLKQGIAISHIDSHHHIHTIPWLFSTLKRIQKRYQIKKVRIGLNWYYKGEYTPSLCNLVGKKLWNWSLRNYYKTKTTDTLTPLQWYVRNVRKEEKRKVGVVEIMCHPGRSWASAETELLWSDWIQQLPYKIKLISFNDI